tara:strand:- start:246 stop:3944 length:3699 start_codon:yes stop_codon:yes gene_type:complete
MSTRTPIPTFNSYNVAYTLSGSCTGSITNLVLAGGTGPYTLSWVGPSSYTANTTTLTSLCAGAYSGTVTDVYGSASTEVIIIGNLPPVSLSASVIDNSCVTNVSKYCQIKVHSFTHTQPEVKYNLFKDGILEDSVTYIGPGNHPHTFKNLTDGGYTITAHDGNFYTYEATSTSGCGATNTTTGNMSASTIVENWTRVSQFGDYAKYFHGPADTYPTGYFSEKMFFTDFTDGEGAWYITSGLATTGEDESKSKSKSDKETTRSEEELDYYTVAEVKEEKVVKESEDDRKVTKVIEDYSAYAPYFWFYTGATANRLTNSSKDWYQPNVPLAQQAAYEGQDVGPTTITKSLANSGTFYWSTKINRFVVLFFTAVPGTNWQWVTFNPRNNQGIEANPSAATGLTSSTNWGCQPITNNQFTISGTNNTVVSATTKQMDNGVGSCMIQCTSNSGLPNGFISSCSYLNYTHEVTLGSTSSDDDTIGLYLAWFKDTLGEYGPKNVSHNITLTFANRNGASAPTVNLTYNYGNSASSFSLMNNEQPWNSTFSGTIGTSPSPYRFVSSNDFNRQGNVRVRITRSGQQGELFKIQMTDTMGNTGATQTHASTFIGQTNDYNPDYELNFSLLDTTTWSGRTTTVDSKIITGNELNKFLGSQNYGYNTSSQEETQFYDIAFTGYQSNFEVVATKAGVSKSSYFELYNSKTLNVSHTNPVNDDWNNSFGGAYPGRPEVPVIRPSVKVEMQTYLEPQVDITGATKIDIAAKRYYVYYCDEIQEVPLKLRWVTETAEMRNNNAYAKYSIFPYVPEYGEFLNTPLVSRIFDNVTTQLSGTTAIYTEGSDEVPISNFPCEDFWEYCIKPSSIIKDKLQDIYYSGCKVNRVSGTTATWFDTLDLNPTPTIEYGIYDRDKDYYLILVSKPSKPTYDEVELTYPPTVNQCEVYNQRMVVVTGTTATTATTVSVPDRTFILPLDYQSDGNMQVTVNGITLFKAFNTSMTDGDFYSDGRTLSIKKNTLADGDLINIFYVPNTTNQSTYSQYITVPASGVTSAKTSTLYYKNIYYNICLDYAPLGDIGLVFNGTVLYADSDFKQISNKKIQLLSVQNPGGLVAGDRLIVFYYTRLTVSGIANTANPEVNCRYTTNVRNNEEVNLLVYDSTGTTVYTQTTKLPRGTSGPQSVKMNINVPGPGDYTYNLVTYREYPLIDNNIIKTKNETERIAFKMTPSTYYFTKASTNERYNDSPDV